MLSLLPWTWVSADTPPTLRSTRIEGSLAITWGGSLHVHPSGKWGWFTCVVTLEDRVFTLKPGYWLSRGCSCPYQPGGLKQCLLGLLTWSPTGMPVRHVKVHSPGQPRPSGGHVGRGSELISDRHFL